MLQDRLRSFIKMLISKQNAKTTEVVGEDHVTGVYALRRHEHRGEEHLLNW